MDEAPLSYSSIEVSGCLPAGWRQTGGGVWSPADRVWRTRVRDGADQDWDLEIGARHAARVGRDEALRAAVDRLYREALG